MTVLDKWCFSLRCSSVLTVRQPDVLRRFHVDLLGDIFCPDTRAFQHDLSTSEQKKFLQLFCYSFCQVCSEREERSQRPHTDDKTPESLCAGQDIVTARTSLCETTDCLCCITDVCDSADWTDVCLDFQTLEVSKSCSAKFPHLSGRPNPVFNNASNCIIGVIWASSF